MLSKKYLSRRQASSYCQDQGLPVTVPGLAKMAVRGDGPPFHLAFGRALYAVDRLETWIAEMLGEAFRSTSARTVANAHSEFNQKPNSCNPREMPGHGACSGSSTLRRKSNEH